MLPNNCLRFIYFTFVCGILQAQFAPLNIAQRNSILNILVDFDKVQQAVWELTLFNNLLDDTSRPKRIHNMSNFVLHDSREYKSCKYKSYPTNTPHYSQEIFFIIPQWLSTLYFYRIQLQMAFCGENPSHLFLIDRNTMATSLIPQGQELVQMTSKLFVLGLGDLCQVDVYVFCHPCGSHPLRLIKHTHTNWLKEWELYNHDLNGMELSTGQGPYDPIEKDTCSQLYYSYQPIPFFIACLQLTLSKLHNFTDSQHNIGSQPPGIHEICHNMVLSSDFLRNYFSENSIHKKFLFIHGTRMIRTSFTAISLKPSSLSESFETFLVPFDDPTWIGIIVSILAISGVIAVTKLQSIIQRFGTALFWSYACLTGQYGGTGDILMMLPRSGLQTFHLYSSLLLLPDWGRVLSRVVIILLDHYIATRTSQLYR